MALDILLISELIILALLTLAAYRFIIQRFRRTSLPPGPRGWPVLGVLPLLGHLPHVTLTEMAKRHGPIMYLKMGMQGVAVASSSNAARAFLKTHDLQFSNRPIISSAKHVAYNAQDMVFAECAPRWKLLRKLSNMHMLGAASLNEWVDVRFTEVGHVIRSMCESSSREEPVLIRGMVVCAIANMIGQAALNRRVFESQGSESNEFKEMVEELFLLAGISNIGDLIPAVAWIDLQGFESRLKRLQKRFDALLTRMVNEHVVGMHERKGKPDLLDILVTHPKDSDGVSLSDTNIKALLLNLFTAGTDTTSSTIEWAIAELVKNPSMLERAQAEMDQVIGRNRRLQESDLPKLPYLQAICKEALRMHASTPLSVPRLCTQACEVDGYHIPKNTWLMVNIWAIARDPNVWEKPMEFDPERFLSGREGAKVDPSGAGDLEFIPFGAGRRICAGARMATVVLEYALGSLVQSFDWKVPDGVQLDMDETFGLALYKKEPFSALVTPRLPPSVYV